MLTEIEDDEEAAGVVGSEEDNSGMHVDTHGRVCFTYCVLGRE